MSRVTGGDLPAQIFRDVAARAAPLLSKRSAPAAMASLGGRRDAATTGSVAGASQAKLTGRPKVLDTGTLSVEGQIIRLRGVEGLEGRMARQLGRFMRGREITCETTGDEAECALDGQNLAEMVVAAGGGRAKPDAPEALLAAEEQARSARLGLWRQRQ
jgi:penicillin-binding protein 1A